MEERDIRNICSVHQLPCNNITKVIGSFDKELFFIDDKYLIRTSKQSMYDELYKINRIKDLNHVPKIVHASDQSSTNSEIYYLILEYIQGRELFTTYQELKNHEIQGLGIEISDFLCELHHIKGEKYDIGHYVPILPDYDQSWRSGHEKYWDSIYQGLTKLPLSDELQQLLELSNEYIQSNLFCMDYEKGPSLLHNDFHLKNIIVHDDVFSGVVDWECSQYGEPDFDLIHLLHWCLFPSSKDADLSKLFDTVFLSYTDISTIPMIEKRFTIYLLEHDFIQILWSQGTRTDEFLPRIQWCIRRSLEEYIRNLKESL